MDLIVTPNIAEPDAFYEALIDAQRDMSDDEAELMYAKLVLVLANHIGDSRLLLQALQIAKGAASNRG
jgi:hypothetical protein